MLIDSSTPEFHFRLAGWRGSSKRKRQVKSLHICTLPTLPTVPPTTTYVLGHSTINSTTNGITHTEDHISLLAILDPHLQCLIVVQLNSPGRLHISPNLSLDQLMTTRRLCELPSYRYSVLQEHSLFRQRASKLSSFQGNIFFL